MNDTLRRKAILISMLEEVEQSAKDRKEGRFEFQTEGITDEIMEEFIEITRKLESKDDN